MYFPAVTPTLPQVSNTQESEHLMSKFRWFRSFVSGVLCCELGRGLSLLRFRGIFQTVSCSIIPLTTLYYFCRSFSAFQLPSILHIPTYKCAARGGLPHGERTEQAAFAMPGKVASPSLQTSGIKTVGVQYNDTGGAGSGSGSGNSSANSKDAACSSTSESGGIRGFFSSLFGFSSSPSTGNISSSSNNSSSSNSSSLQSSNTAPVMRATATTTASYSKNTQTKQLTDKQRAALAKVKAQAQSQSQRDK